MKRAVKWGAVILVGLITAMALMFIGTRGHYPVMRLVTVDPTLPTETVYGVQLHMRVVDGPAGAPVIVVLHGGPGGDFRSLQALERLSDQYSVVFYDQRGAGLSERVAAASLTLDGHLAELEGVIEVVSPDRPPILIGHSWGAMLAAAYMGKDPTNVQRAILIEPGYLDAAGRDAWVAESENYMTGIAFTWEAVKTGFRAQHVKAMDADAQDDFLIGHMVGVFTNHPDNPYHCGAGYTAPSWRFGAISSAVWRHAPASEVDRLGSFASRASRPVLLLVGACNDWLGQPLQSRHLKWFQDAILNVIADAGHDVIWDNPDASLLAIRAFLGQPE